MSQNFSIGGIPVVSSRGNKSRIQYHYSRNQYCVVVETQTGTEEEWFDNFYVALAKASIVDSFSRSSVIEFSKIMGIWK